MLKLKVSVIWLIGFVIKMPWFLINVLILPHPLIFRELGPPCSTPIPEPNAMKNLIDNKDFHGSFLTLSLPTTTTTASPSSSFDLHSCVDSKIPDFDTTPFQVRSHNAWPFHYFYLIFFHFDYITLYQSLFILLSFFFCPKGNKVSRWTK